jgi:hypothetical protein
VHLTILRLRRPSDNELVLTHWSRQAIDHGCNARLRRLSPRLG